MGRRHGPSLSVGDVVAAAVRVVETEGPDALGISRVAAELKIKPASMYNHVASGEALARLVALEANRQFLTALQARLEGVTAPRDQLIAIAYQVRDWANENDSLYVHMARVEPDHADLDAAEILSGILAALSAPLGALGVAEGDRVHAMRTLRSALHGFVLLETSGQFQLGVNTGDSFEWLVDRLIAGVTGEQSSQNAPA